MSLMFMSGFDHDVYAYRMALAGGISSPGRFGRGRFLIFTHGSHFANFTLTAGEQHHSYYIGFACRDDASPYTDLAYSSSLVRIFGDTGQLHTAVYYNSPGAGQYRINACRASTANVLGSSANISLQGGVWHYWEIKIVIDDTVGEVVVKRDEVTILNLANINTRNGGTNANASVIQFGNNSNNGQGSLDDVYILKNDGVGQSNFLGEIEVEALVPNGNGTYSQLVGSDGNSVDHYLLVDDSTAVNDTDYVGSPTDGDKDTYTIGNLVRTNTVIKGAQLSFRARKSDTNPKSTRRVIRSGGVDSPGTDIPLASSFAWNQEVLEQNPITGLDWTQSDIDGLEIGSEVRP